MFSDILSGLTKFLGKKWIPIIVIILISAVLMYYSSSKNGIFDKMSTGMDSASASSQGKGQAPAQAQAAAPAPAPAQAQAASGYSMQPVANPSDLLPNDQNSQWAALNPVGNGHVAMPDLLQAGYHIGLDTIGQTLKNANLQLRSDPIIEKKDIGPWNQSTYEADYGRVPLEVGYGAR